MSAHETIAKLLLTNIPRDFWLNLQRLVPNALERATAIGAHAAHGHRNTLTGHSRHIFLNEALMTSFEETGIPHPPLRGNKIMLGKVGITTLARIHMNQHKWDNSRRSKTKVELCAPNRKVVSLVQGDMFIEQESEIDAVTVFIVTEGSVSPSGECRIFIVVPDETMDIRNPVFNESVSLFVQRYHATNEINDKAFSKLKKDIRRQKPSEES